MLIVSYLLYISDFKLVEDEDMENDGNNNNNSDGRDTSMSHIDEILSSTSDTLSTGTTIDKESI